VRSGEWARRLPTDAKPRVRFGPIAAGEVVHYSATSGERRWLHEHYNDAIAVEMEGAGTASAAHLNDSLPAVVVRGISDHADSGKSATDHDGWQSRAAINAAAFAIELPSCLAAELGNAAGDPENRSGEDPGAGRPFNVAAGNAQVKVQAHTVYGGIRFGPDAALGPGSSLLSARPANGPGMLTLTARRIYALISNAVELTTKVISALTAIRGLR
jgi:8-oxo-dGTP diphosphatase